MNPDLRRYSDLIRQHIYRDFTGMLRAPAGTLKYPFVVPGSKQYSDQLWDWDSWWTTIALYQIAEDLGDQEQATLIRDHARGCVLNFLEIGNWDGWIPYILTAGQLQRPADIYQSNMHKPCLAQQAAFLVQRDDGEAGWLRDRFYALQAFVNNYYAHHRHAPTGLYFWQDDVAIGGDNDPCVYRRPARSCGPVFLNAMMYRELLAMVYLAEQLNLCEIAASYRKDAAQLQAAMQEHQWDPWLGFYFNVDLNVADEKRPGAWEHIHEGAVRKWDCLIQRIGIWSGFLPMWAGVANQAQAERMLKYYYDEQTFACPAGVRTLSKQEKMYDVRATGNPSSWLGPVWGIVNYMVFRGFVRYRMDEAAADLAAKTIRLFGRDYERFGALHEYYQPENGEPILNPGFQNWNLLVLNMIRWLEKRESVEEF